MGTIMTSQPDTDARFLQINNPFFDKTPAPPSYFIGRRREIGIILDRLANPLSRGGSAIIGEHGIGKTSLLHYLQSPKALDDWHHLSSDISRFVFMPGYFIVPFTELNFWLYLFQDLQDWLQGAYGEVDLLVSELEAGRLPSVHALIKFFTKLGEERGSFVIVLLDNFDLLFESMRGSNWQENMSFLQKLRGLMNLPPPRGFSLVASSEGRLFELFSEVQWFGSQFFNNMTVLNMAPFTKQEVGELIDSYIGPGHIEFTPEEVDQLFEVSQGHPGKLQELASDMFNRKKQSLPVSPPVEEVIDRLSLSDFEPEVADLLARAMDKLFYEAGTVQLIEDAEERVSQEITREQMGTWRFSVPTKDQQDELRHQIDMLDTHRRNIRTLEKQMAELGGETMSPLDRINQREAAKEEIKKYLGKLVCTLQQVFGRPIEAIG